MTAERQGVPAMGVMTTRFVSAAELMARVLGMEGYAFSVIPHPVSSASGADLERMAASAVEDARKMLLSRR